jgi:hypothetical protein
MINHGRDPSPGHYNHVFLKVQSWKLMNVCVYDQSIIIDEIQIHDTIDTRVHDIFMLFVFSYLNTISISDYVRDI